MSQQSLPDPNARIADWFVENRYVPALNRRLPTEADGAADLHRAARAAGLRVPAAALPLWCPPRVLRSFARVVARRWSVPERRRLGPLRALKELEGELGSWEKAKKRAARVGLCLAVARLGEPRAVRLGQQWVTQDGQKAEVPVRELPSLKAAFRHLLTEGVTAAEAWLLEKPYRLHEGEDAFEEAHALPKNVPAPEGGLEALEAAEGAADAWTVIRQAAEAWDGVEALEATTDYQRQILEVFFGHLENLHVEEAFGGDPYRQVAEATQRTADEFGISRNAVHNHLHRIRADAT